MSGCGYSPAIGVSTELIPLKKLFNHLNPLSDPLSALRQCTPLWAPPPPAQRSYKKDLISALKIIVLLLVQHKWGEIL